MKTKTKNSSSKEKGASEIHILNGPNLNMLGRREPEIYGLETLTDIEDRLVELAKKEASFKVKLCFFQTNFEGEMLHYIHKLVLGPAEKDHVLGVIINPGGWTHTSVALRDAVTMLQPIPLVEVHMSNIMEREEFRHYSFLEDIVDYRVMGKGAESYVEALRWLLNEGRTERQDVH